MRSQDESDKIQKRPHRIDRMRFEDLEPQPAFEIISLEPTIEPFAIVLNDLLDKFIKEQKVHVSYPIAKLQDFRLQ